ncbi:MAG: L,D-transpeptidase [Candidatus Woesebacteria bacterium]|jgi:lipoprotein-anchoring transpeptidase ErfK/SrfK
MKKSKKLKKSPIIWLVSSFAAIVLIISFAIYTQACMIFSPKGKIDEKSLTGEYDKSQTIAVFNNKELPLPSDLESTGDGQDKVILGNSSEERTIRIDLTGQRLFMYEGERVIDYFLISSGKWGRTPTGEFWIWSKFRYTKMSGGSRALGTYYYLPNVPYVMFFYNRNVAKSRGYSIHGTYWHNNFGTPMSHGCINMKTEDAQKVYSWAGIGTRVIITGKAPLY